MEEENFREEEKNIEKARGDSMALVRDAMRILKSRIGKALLDAEEELKKDITEVYKIDREGLRKKKERARRR